MSADERTYDRAEVDVILRKAAELDSTRSLAPALPVERDGLTVAEIQGVAREAGIGADAITAATLALALERAHRGEHRLQHSLRIPRTLDANAMKELPGIVRGIAPEAAVRRVGDGVELEIGKRGSMTGGLVAEIRSSAGGTTVTVWSDAPHVATSELATAGLAGVAAVLFPVVAASAGHWPAFVVSLGFAAAGAVLGTGAAVGWQRWATDRWRKRLEEILVPIVARICHSERSEESAPPGA